MNKLRRFALLILMVTSSEAGSLCDAFQNLSPCKCERLSTGNEQFETSIECHQLISANQLFNVTRATNGTVVDNFNLFSSKVGYLPSNLFLHSNVRRIQIYDTPLTHFTEAKESAFLGLDKYLEELTLRRCELTQNAKVDRLEHLSSLTSLDLSYNQISVVPSAWFKLPPRKLAQLILKGNGIEMIENEAFSSLIELRVLDLSENFIQTLETTILQHPGTASRLEYIYLSYNYLQNLPKGFFHNMHIIKRVYLDHNKLTVLSSDVFEPLWKTNNLLAQVDFLGNDLLCDISLCWMAFYDNEHVTGSCAEPDLLRGRRLRTLWPWDLHCNETLYNGDTVLSYRAKL